MFDAITYTSRKSETTGNNVLQHLVSEFGCNGIINTPDIAIFTSVVEALKYLPADGVLHLCTVHGTVNAIALRKITDSKLTGPRGMPGCHYKGSVSRAYNVCVANAVEVYNKVDMADYYSTVEFKDWVLHSSLDFETYRDKIHDQLNVDDFKMLLQYGPDVYLDYLQLSTYNSFDPESYSNKEIEDLVNALNAKNIKIDQLSEDIAIKLARRAPSYCINSVNPIVRDIAFLDTVRRDPVRYLKHTDPKIRHSAVNGVLLGNYPNVLELLSFTPDDPYIHIRELVLQHRLFVDKFVNDVDKTLARRARHYRNRIVDKIWLFFHPGD
jgi:hypothetical protein